MEREKFMDQISKHIFIRKSGNYEMGHCPICDKEKLAYSRQINRFYCFSCKRYGFPEQFMKHFGTKATPEELEVLKSDEEEFTRECNGYIKSYINEVESHIPTPPGWKKQRKPKTYQSESI
jgi:hypothetical protein